MFSLNQVRGVDCAAIDAKPKTKQNKNNPKWVAALQQRAQPVQEEGGSERESELDGKEEGDLLYH